MDASRLSSAENCRGQEAGSRANRTCKGRTLCVLKPCALGRPQEHLHGCQPLVQG